MPKSKTSTVYSTAEVAARAGVHKDTLLRWLRAGVVAEPNRDRHGWRFFDDAQLAEVVRYASSTTTPNVDAPDAPSLNALGDEIKRLQLIDWDFANAKTDYLTHGLHPYPAKYIPQIPNALIQELSVTGETVGDIFCGSGTTLVEALTLKRHAVGVDANPLACLISRVKTSLLGEDALLQLGEMASHVESLAGSIAAASQGGLFGAAIFTSKGERPSLDDIGFWFEPHVIEELAEAKRLAMGLANSEAREAALVCLSSIIVNVSKQDSDTRYVRRDKDIAPGDTLKRFARSLRDAVRRLAEFADVREPRFDSTVVRASVLDAPIVPTLDLVVCSPPYPNAFSYHLYHRTRMLWLGMDQPTFKREEIGSHRKYSSKGKNAATVYTFSAEMQSIFRWLRVALRPQRFACFVVGDSTLGGQRINNADLIAEAAAANGFRRVVDLERTMQATKKAFNPAIGRIKTESIVILQNGMGSSQ